MKTGMKTGVGSRARTSFAGRRGCAGRGPAGAGSYRSRVSLSCLWPTVRWGGGEGRRGGLGSEEGGGAVGGGGGPHGRAGDP